jgi:hypothetical protein
MVQKVDIPLQSDKQMPHWFWQVYRRINLSILDNNINPGPLTITSNGSGGGTLLLTGSQTDLWITDTNGGTQTWRILAKNGTTADFRIFDETRGADTIDIDGTGKVFINKPTSGTTLRLGAASGGEALKLEESLSGATIYGYVHNTSNTGSSSAALIIGVGGTSAGDPIVRWDVDSGGQIWAAGIDNSDSDKFKISKNSTLGTNDYLIIDTSGNTTLSGILTIGSYTIQTPITVASLPAAATGNQGARYFVSDATATTYASVVAGGGANIIPVYSDGTNWRIG